MSAVTNRSHEHNVTIHQCYTYGGGGGEGVLNLCVSWKRYDVF